jgi:hypothetical protein
MLAPRLILARLATLFLLLATLTGCGVASVTITRPDGTTIKGFGVAMFKDIGLDNLKYRTTPGGDRAFDLGGYNSQTSAAAINALERIANSAPIAP